MVGAVCAIVSHGAACQEENLAGSSQATAAEREGEAKKRAKQGERRRSFDRRRARKPDAVAMSRFLPNELLGLRRGGITMSHSNSAPPLFTAVAPTFRTSYSGDINGKLSITIGKLSDPTIARKTYMLLGSDKTLKLKTGEYRGHTVKGFPAQRSYYNGTKGSTACAVLHNVVELCVSMKVSSAENADESVRYLEALDLVGLGKLAEIMRTAR
jgi:hypothetical protein